MFELSVVLVRVVVGIMSWSVMFVLQTVLILLGWVLVPVAAVSGAYRFYTGMDGVGTPRTQAAFTWPFMWLWDNFEDGIMNDMYWKAPAEIWGCKLGVRQRDILQIIYWSCLRNPVNNMRRVPILSVMIEPDRVKWIGGPHERSIEFDLKPAKAEWFFAWCGFYSGVWWQFSKGDAVWRFWIGWKIFPRDQHGVTGHRANGAGFGSQFKRVL